MKVFRTALRVWFKHPVYLAVYVVALSFLAVAIGKSVTTTSAKTYAADRPTIAIIDRDGSPLSRGLADFLSAHAATVQVADTKVALQDATAQDYASYIAVIPSGFGADFVSAATQEKAEPKLQTIISYDSASGSLMNQLANAYLNTARTYATSRTATGQRELARLTTADMEKGAQVTMVQSKSAAAPSEQYQTFLSFSGYTIMMSIIVCAGVVMVAFNRGELRRRNLASPVSSLSRNLQIAAGCLVVALLSWAWVSILGLVVFGSVLGGVGAGVIMMLMLSLLVYCTVPLAIGFLLGQLASNEMILNAVGNIAGLAFAFLGGIWIPVSMLSSGLRQVARFIPTYYYSQALTKLSALKVVSASTLGPVFVDWAMMLLFAVVIFAAALVVGRLRMQSANAGGNAAAARSVA